MWTKYVGHKGSLRMMSFYEKTNCLDNYVAVDAL